MKRRSERKPGPNKRFCASNFYTACKENDLDLVKSSLAAKSTTLTVLSKGLSFCIDENKVPDVELVKLIINQTEFKVTSPQLQNLLFQTLQKNQDQVTKRLLQSGKWTSCLQFNVYNIRAETELQPKSCWEYNDESLKQIAGSNRQSFTLNEIHQLVACTFWATTPTLNASYYQKLDLINKQIIDQAFKIFFVYIYAASEVELVEDTRKLIGNAFYTNCVRPLLFFAEKKERPEQVEGELIYEYQGINSSAGPTTP